MTLSTDWTIAREDPQAGDLDLLFARHTAQMHAETPPESIHMLPRAALRAPGIAFFVMRDADGRPAAMGALKRIDAGHGELKSMHVLAEHRGRGLSRLLLAHLLSEAGACGMERVSLETGIEPGFEAARRLYAQAGFAPCAPFGDYRPDPNSLFMTRRIPAP